MNTGRIYEFLVLAKLLSFSKAADALYISQSVLSKHIQELEEELGSPVLIRNTHGVSLTEAGKVLMKEAPELINKCDSVLRRLRSRNSWSKGSIRIGIAMEFAHSGHIRQSFHTFSSRYPDIELKYDVFSGNMPSHVAGEYDILFTPCVYHDLPENIHRLLLRRHGTYAQELFGPYAQNWILAEKATKGQLSIIKVDNVSTALFLVSMGKGICIAPRYVKNMLSPETFIVSISDQNCRFDEYLYYNETGNEAAKLFFEEYPELK